MQAWSQSYAELPIQAENSHQMFQYMPKPHVKYKPGIFAWYETNRSRFDELENFNFSEKLLYSEVIPFRYRFWYFRLATFLQVLSFLFVFS